MNYEIEHSVEIHFSGIPKLQTDETLQLWIPTPKGVVAEFSFNPTTSEDLADIGCTLNHWKEIPIENTIIKCFYEHSGIPRIPPTTAEFLSKSLAANEPLINITKGILNTPLLREIGSRNVQDQIDRVKRYLIGRLKYEYPPQTREAEGVLRRRRSDCGGYHSTFVALARSLKIPAVLDFGFRTKTDNYHVWAWWFNLDTQSWIMEDLNDEQENRPPSRRVSMTLSTAPELIPPYPQPVLYLQSHLVWINNITQLEKIGLKFNHNSRWNVKP